MFVRKDISSPQIAVQACHAVIEAAPKISSDREHPHLVLIGVRSELQLVNAHRRLSALGVRCSQPFCEPDMGDQLTAFATEPVSGDSRQLFKNYQCLREVDLLPVVKGGAA